MDLERQREAETAGLIRNSQRRNDLERQREAQTIEFSKNTFTAKAMNWQLFYTESHGLAVIFHLFYNKAMDRQPFPCVLQ